MEARFCGFCGFRMAPISSNDWKSLTDELQPIEVDNPVILSEVKKVEGKGAQYRPGKVGAAPAPGPGSKETKGPRVVGKWEEPPVRVFPRGTQSASKDTSKGRENGDSSIVASAPPPAPRPSTVPPGKATASGRPVTGGMKAVTPLIEEPPPPPPVAPRPPMRVTPPPYRPSPFEVAPTSPPVRQTPTPRSPVRQTPAPPPPVGQTPAPPPPVQATPPPVQAAPPPPVQAEPSTPGGPDSRTARRYRRFPLKVEVGYATDHNFYTGFLENLSSGGLFIATHQPTQIGEVMEVTFTVPGIPAPCAAICQVTWLRDYDASNEDMVPGMGLKFIQLDPKVRAAVELFIKHREPIFFD